MEHKLYKIVEVLKQGYSTIRIEDRVVTCIGLEEGLRIKKHHR